VRLQFLTEPASHVGSTDQDQQTAVFDCFDHVSS
jgi:hypothetical protein